MWHTEKDRQRQWNEIQRLETERNRSNETQRDRAQQRQCDTETDREANERGTERERKLI